MSCSFLLSSIRHHHILMPSVRLKEKLNTQGPVVIKSSVSGLFSPAASLSTANTHWGWPILHYGLSEKGSIAASRAVKSVWPPSGFSVRHQSQTERERQTDDPGGKSWTAKLWREEKASAAECWSERCAAGAFCDDINKRGVSLQDEISSVWKSDAEHLNCLDPPRGGGNIINLYQTSEYRLKLR